MANLFGNKCSLSRECLIFIFSRKLWVKVWGRLVYAALYGRRAGGSGATRGVAHETALSAAIAVTRTSLSASDDRPAILTWLLRIARLPTPIAESW